MITDKTPKEEAKELVKKYINASFNCKDCDILYCDVKCTNLSEHEAALCAIIAVDKIIEVLTQVISPSLHGFLHEHYKEVKQELLKL